MGAGLGEGTRMDKKLQQTVPWRILYQEQRDDEMGRIR